MKKVFVFLLGSISAVIVMAGGLAIWLIRTPPPPVQPVSVTETGARTEPSPSAGAAGAVAQTPEAVPPQPFKIDTPPASPSPNTRPTNQVLFLDVVVVVPEPLRKMLATKKNVLLTVGAVPDEGNQSRGSIFADGGDLLMDTYPRFVRLRLNPHWASLLTAKPEVPLLVNAAICYDLDAATLAKRGFVCGHEAVPSVRSWSRFTVKLGALAGVEKISAPPVVMKSVWKKFDAAACARDGGTLTGKIQATPTFLRTRKAKGKIELVAVPFFDRTLPPVFLGSGPAHPSAADLKSLAKYGISRQQISVADERPVPFRMPIPEEFRRDRFLLLAAECEEGISEDDCTASMLPARYTTMEKENETVFRPKAKGFGFPQCGEGADQIFYLHRFDPKAPNATQASVSASNPPELIEGTTY
jgi:hypothetical protein